MTRHTGPSQAVLGLVKARNGGMCLRCSKAPGQQCHHRKPRGMGGTSDPRINWPVNLVWLCQECHRRIELDRTEAYRNGWLVARTADPESQYLIDSNQRMLMLLPDGSMVSNDPPASSEVPF